MLAFSTSLKGVPLVSSAVEGFSVSDGGPPSLQRGHSWVRFLNQAR
jgi:hypothetical protein